MTFMQLDANEPWKALLAPAKFSPTILPSLFAPVANGTYMALFVMALLIVAQSPAAYTSSIEVLPYLSTTIAPFFSISIPLSFKKAVFGLKPVATITISVSNSLLSVLIVVMFSFLLISITVSSNNKLTSWFLISSSNKSVISLSKTSAKILSCNCTTVTSLPFFLAASITSTPINPAPITVTLLILLSSIRALTLYPSSIDLSVKTFSESIPLIGGIILEAPVAIINLSYDSSIEAPVIRSFTCNFLPPKSTFITS